MKKNLKYGLIIGGSSLALGAAITGGTWGIVQAVQNKKAYEQYKLETISWAKAHVNSALLGGIAKQPEAISKLRSMESTYRSALNQSWITPNKAMAIGYLGGGFEMTEQWYYDMSEDEWTYNSSYSEGGILSVARQPEAEGKIVGMSTYLLTDIKNYSDQAALAIGIAGSYILEGIARQPEAEGKIRGIWYDYGQSRIDRITNNNGWGIGYAIGKAAEAVARQPEAESKIRSMLGVGLNNIMNNNVSELVANAIGCCAGKACMAMAAQPDSEEQIKELFSFISSKTLSYSSDFAECFYECAPCIEAIAQAPDLLDKFKQKLNDVIFNSLETAQPIHARSIGQVAGSMCVAISASPEDFDTIVSIAKVDINNILSGK